MTRLHFIIDIIVYVWAGFALSHWVLGPLILALIAK